MLSSNDYAAIDGEVERLRRRFLPGLRLGGQLETEFERDTAKARSYRLWVEGLFAILLLNACLLADYILVVHDSRWRSVVARTEFVTPIALVINFIVRLNPELWIREGSVAVGMVVICLINLHVEGNATASATTFGLICVLICILFTDLVMRIRLPYALASTAAMSLNAFWFVAHAAGLQPPEKIVAASLMAMGIAITLITGYRLEREERLEYLLQLRFEVQGRELSQTNLRLQDLSTRDTLTGLLNRRAFEERFAELWVEGQQLNSPLSVILLDVDQFKVLNDKGGHMYGDRVLRRVAELLPQGLRGPRDVAARFGGDEFVILLPNTQIDTAAAVAERIRVLIELLGTPSASQTFGEEILLNTISCGVATCLPDNNIGKDEVLVAADRALYEAKSLGRNRVSSQ